MESTGWGGEAGRAGGAGDIRFPLSVEARPVLAAVVVAVVLLRGHGRGADLGHVAARHGEGVHADVVVRVRAAAAGTRARARGLAAVAAVVAGRDVVRRVALAVADGVRVRGRGAVVVVLGGDAGVERVAPGHVLQVAAALGPPPVRAAEVGPLRAGEALGAVLLLGGAGPALADGRVGGVLGRRHGQRVGPDVRDGVGALGHLDLVLDEDRAAGGEAPPRRRLAEDDRDVV